MRRTGGHHGTSETARASRGRRGDSRDLPRRRAQQRQLGEHADPRPPSTGRQGAHRVSQGPRQGRRARPGPDRAGEAQGRQPQRLPLLNDGPLCRGPASWTDGSQDRGARQPRFRALQPSRARRAHLRRADGDRSPQGRRCRLRRAEAPLLRRGDRGAGRVHRALRRVRPAERGSRHRPRLAESAGSFRKEDVVHGRSHHGPPALWLALAALCGALMASPARAATYVYVGNTDSNEFHVLQLERQSGDLTLVQVVPIPGVTKPGNSTPMAVSPDRRFLYAGTRGEPKIAAGFAIDPTTGKLTHVASGPLPDSMAYIATDRTGRFLLGASYPGHKITVSPIGPPGTVQPAHQVLTDHPNAHSILADASNRHVLAPTLGNDLVNQFTFDATTGMLAPNTPPSVRSEEHTSELQSLR